jgi:hypothetical protein
MYIEQVFFSKDARLGALVEIGLNVTIFICDYMQLLVFYNHIWTFLQLFLIFVTTMQLVCNYFVVHPSMWTTFSLVFIQEKQFMSH